MSDKSNVRPNPSLDGPDYFPANPACWAMCGEAGFRGCHRPPRWWKNKKVQEGLLLFCLLIEVIVNGCWLVLSHSISGFSWLGEILKISKMTFSLSCFWELTSIYVLDQMCFECFFFPFGLRYLLELFVVLQNWVKKESLYIYFQNCFLRNSRGGGGG